MIILQSAQIAFFVAIMENIGFSPFAVIYVEEVNICYLKNKKEEYHT